jgi:hypothetical protein
MCRRKGAVIGMGGSVFMGADICMRKECCENQKQSLGIVAASRLDKSQERGISTYHGYHRLAVAAPVGLTL